MKKYLSLFSLCIILAISCSERSEPNNDEIATQLIKDNISASINNRSVFKIKNEKDTLIVSKKGIKLKIDKHSFVDANGQQVTEEVEVKIKEVTNAKEMLFENISTITKNGILETKGMIKIEAYANGEALKMAENKNLEISFPTNGKENDNASLYYGKENDNNIIEWEIDNTLEDHKTIEEKYITDISIKYKLLEDLDNKNAYFKNKSDGHKVLREVLTFSEVEKKRLLNDYIRIFWILFDDGDLEVYRINGNISQQRKEEIENKLNNVAYIKPFIREGDVAEMDGVIDIRFFENKDHQEAKEFYQLTVSKLGWINCDIFIKFNSPKIDMYVDVEKDADVKILFKNYDTIITGYPKDNKTIFSKIPQEEPINIIAIKYDPERNGALYSITETIAQKNVSKLAPFQFLTLDELGKKIESLN